MNIDLRRIPADPKVALGAWEADSNTEPGTVHHVALRVGDAGEDCPRGPGRHLEVLSRGGGRIECAQCFAVLRWFDCDCKGFVKHDHCWHVTAARRLWAEERRRGR
jgi:hypothetical protein